MAEITGIRPPQIGKDIFQNLWRPNNNTRRSYFGVITLNKKELASINVQLEVLQRQVAECYSHRLGFRLLEPAIPHLEIREQSQERVVLVTRFRGDVLFSQPDLEQLAEVLAQHFNNVTGGVNQADFVIDFGNGLAYNLCSA